jgi:hypothetical protein
MLAVSSLLSLGTVVYSLIMKSFRIKYKMINKIFDTIVSKIVKIMIYVDVEDSKNKGKMNFLSIPHINI